MQPEANKEKWKEKKEEEESIKQRLNAKPVLRPEETIAERREKRVIKIPSRFKEG